MVSKLKSYVQGTCVIKSFSKLSITDFEVTLLLHNKSLVDKFDNSLSLESLVVNSDGPYCLYTER